MSVSWSGRKEVNADDETNTSNCLTVGNAHSNLCLLHPSTHPSYALHRGDASLVYITVYTIHSHLRTQALNIKFRALRAGSPIPTQKRAENKCMRSLFLWLINRDREVTRRSTEIYLALDHHSPDESQKRQGALIKQFIVSIDFDFKIMFREFCTAMMMGPSIRSFTVQSLARKAGVSNLQFDFKNLAT